MSVVAKPQLDEASARGLTNEVKADAASLWMKLVDLYEGGAHTALGYRSWGSYYEAEFGRGSSAGYKLLQTGQVMRSLQESAGDLFQEPYAVDRGPLPASERVARELVPLRAAPERLREAWSEAVSIHGEQPTAAQVREIVQRPGPKTAFKQAADSGIAVLDSQGYWQTGKDPKANGGTDYQAIADWAREIETLPTPSEFVMPWYGREKCLEAARCVRDYLEQFLSIHDTETTS